MPYTGPDPSAFVDRPHGTRLRYMSGCRCVPCRAANSRYECERLAARKRGEGNGIVSAEPARRHLLKLAAAGIGRRAVADASGVAASVIQGIRKGTRTKCRAGTLRAILDVDKGARGGASFVDAGPTWRRIEQLLGEGFSKAELARRLGMRVPALQLRRDRVTAKNAMRVEKLWRSQMEVGS